MHLPILKILLSQIKDLYSAEHFLILSSLMRKPKNIKIMNRIINIITGKKNTIKYTKTIFTIFVSSKFTDILTNVKNIEDDPISLKVYNISKKIKKFLWQIYKGNNLTLQINKRILVKEFDILIDSYKEWTKIDTIRIIDELVLCYIENIEYKDKHRELEEYIDKEQSSIIKKAMILDKKYNEVFFKSKYKAYSDYKKFLIDLSKNIEKNMTQAFWDNIKEKLNHESPDFLCIIPLLKETKNLLKGCVPNKKNIHNDIDEHIDLSFIEHMIKNEGLDNSYIENMLKFITDYLKSFQSRNDDLSTEEWIKELSLKLQSNNYGDFFVFFFKTIINKLNKIINDSIVYKNLIKETN